MKLSDGSDLGISTETIASPGHTLGRCPKGMIWFKVIRAVSTSPYSSREIRQYWIQVPLPRDEEEVKQYLALVRKKGKQVSWMFLYLSELTPQNVASLSEQDWENVRTWLTSERVIQGLRAALELCRRQHEANVRAPAPVEADDELEGFPASPIQSQA